MRLTKDMLLDHNSTDAKECTAFEVQYHVRGRRKRQPLKGRCQTVQGIIDLGQQSFPAFADRNPWLRRTLTEFLSHYHFERNHQGKENMLLFPAPGSPPPRPNRAVSCHPRLGGLLKFYRHAA